MANDPISSPLIPAALRDALRVSPDNDVVLQHAGYAEAEILYRRALAIQPDHQPIKLGLATAFFQQGKNSAALVIVETLVKQTEPSPRALLLHARLAFQ